MARDNYSYNKYKRELAKKKKKEEKLQRKLDKKNKSPEETPAQPPDEAGAVIMERSPDGQADKAQ